MAEPTLQREHELESPEMLRLQAQAARLVEQATRDMAHRARRHAMELDCKAAHMKGVAARLEVLAGRRAAELRDLARRPRASGNGASE